VEKRATIRAASVALAENEVDAAWLARLQHATVEAVRRSLGDLRLYTSVRPEVELGTDAARRCLASAKLDPADLDAIIWTSGSHKHGCLWVQRALGAKQAFALDTSTNCADVLVALRLAQALVERDDLRRVLIVSGERWSELIPNRSLGLLREDSVWALFSDGGGALVVETDGEGPRPIGYGFASDGTYCDALEVRAQNVAGQERGVGFVEGGPSPLEIAFHEIGLQRLALDRCLASAGITREQIDHILMQTATAEMQAATLRRLGLPGDRVVRCAGMPSHIGATDVMVGLDLLTAPGRSTPGQHVLVGARTVGFMRFALLRL
jgi:3-oxoacyl-[acyl-carrier-protein] synthase-3